MAVAPSYPALANPQYAVEYCDLLADRRKYSATGRGRIGSRLPTDGFFNSQIWDIYDINEASEQIVASQDINKQYIKYIGPVKKQYYALKEYLVDISLNEVERALATSLEDLFVFNFDHLKIELVQDGALFYSIKKSGYSIYLQKFFDSSIEEDEDEAFMSIFKGDSKEPSRSGSWSVITQQLQEILSTLN